MPMIRDTIDPTREREVSDEEALDLERQHIVLTGTRARTPDGLRAAAVRQVTEQLEASPVAPVVVVGVGEPAGTPDDGDDIEDDIEDDDDDNSEHQDPGPAPDSTTDPSPTDSQES